MAIFRVDNSSRIKAEGSKKIMTPKKGSAVFGFVLVFFILILTCLA